MRLTEWNNKFSSITNPIQTYNASRDIGKIIVGLDRAISCITSRIGKYSNVYDTIIDTLLWDEVFNRLNANQLHMATRFNINKLDIKYIDSYSNLNKLINILHNQIIDDSNLRLWAKYET